MAADRHDKLADLSEGNRTNLLEKLGSKGAGDEGPDNLGVCLIPGQVGGLGVGRGIGRVQRDEVPGEVAQPVEGVFEAEFPCLEVDAIWEQGWQGFDFGSAAHDL